MTAAPHPISPLADSSARLPVFEDTSARFPWFEDNDDDVVDTEREPTFCEVPKEERHRADSGGFSTLARFAG